MNIKPAFKNSFYLTKQYLEFCSKVTGIPLGENSCLKKKNIAVHTYSKAQKKKMQKKNISYMSVDPTLKESAIEYPLILKNSYKTIYENYSRTFKKRLRKVPKEISIEIVRNIDSKTLDKIYRLYASQMHKLNSFVFPREFFTKFMNLKESLVFILKHKTRIVAYAFCFEYKDNMYWSTGGGDPKYYRYNIMQKLYDQRIQYACNKKLNIHMGLTGTGSGHENFKQQVGAIHYKCERFPNDQKTIKIATFLLKFKVTGLINRWISKKWPKKVVFEMMPFT